MLALNRFFLLLAVFAMFLAGASPALASNVCDVPGNLILNCGFQTGNFSGWTTPIPLPDYYLVAPADTPNGTPQADSKGNGYYVYDGTYAAQLGTLDPATLSQTFSDVAGDQYELSFYLNGDTYMDAANFFDATVAGSTLDLTDVTAFWTEYTLLFTATGTDTLTFTTDDPLGDFLSLDDVEVVPAVTPEPSSLLLLGTGITALAGLIFRRFLWGRKLRRQNTQTPWIERAVGMIGSV